MCHKFVHLTHIFTSYCQFCFRRQITVVLKGAYNTNIKSLQSTWTQCRHLSLFLWSIHMHSIKDQSQVFLSPTIKDIPVHLSSLVLITCRFPSLGVTACYLHHERLFLAISLWVDMLWNYHRRTNHCIDNPCVPVSSLSNQRHWIQG